MEELNRRDHQSMTFTCQPHPPGDNKRLVAGMRVVLPGAISEVPVLNQATPPLIPPSSALQEAGVEDPTARPAEAEGGGKEEDSMGQEESKGEMPPCGIPSALLLLMGCSSSNIRDMQSLP